MQSEVDVALVVFFGAVSFLSTSSVLYKIISAFTFTSSSIVAIYRLFSVQLALVSTVLFSVITGAKSSEWRCSVSAFAVMYCNLSVCASVLLLTKINSDLISDRRDNKHKESNVRSFFRSARNLVSSDRGEGASSNSVVFTVDSRDILTNGDFATNGKTPTASASASASATSGDGGMHHKHRYKTWMFALTFVLPLVALLPLTTDTYKYDSQFENSIVPFCSYYYQNRWGLRWVIFELYCVELLLVTATVAIYARVLYGVHSGKIVLDDSQGEGGGISRKQLVLAALYPVVLFLTWIPQYVWLETPFEYGIPTEYPEWVLKLSFIFWMMSGIIYSIVFALQYSSLLLFEEWADSLESIRVSCTMHKKASVEKQMMNFVSAIKMVNNESTTDVIDADDDLRLSTVIRPSEYDRRRQLVLEYDKRSKSTISMSSMRLSSIKINFMKRLTGMGLYGRSESNSKSDVEMAASAIDALTSSNDEDDDVFDANSIVRPASAVLNTADIYGKGLRQSIDGSDVVVFSAVSPLYRGAGTALRLNQHQTTSHTSHNI